MKPESTILQERWRKLQGNSRLWRWMRAGLLLFTLSFLFVLLLRGHEQLYQLGNWRNCLGACIVGFLLYPLSLIIHAWTWSRMIARLSRSQSGWWDVEIYAYTHLIRHLPGAVWYLATRSLMYRDRGIKASVTLVASGLEWLWLLLGGILVYALFNLTGVGLFLLGLAVLGMLLAIGAWLPRLIHSLDHWQRIPAFGQRWLERLSVVALPTGSDLLLWGGAYVLTYGVAGTIFFLLVRSVAPMASLTLGEAMQVWALTSSVGTLMTGLVPAGLGVRELTMTALLAPKVTTVAALFVAVLVRLLFIAGDLVWGGLMWFIAHVAERHAT